ncbi:uncharacterized protein LOC127279618 [Leptopilina boulardi]|uniref:uncharacterized protein LOC127279618 n=1 Tax=Leptopilina boulardi TaxID=63433 RepID=UPI0021F63BDE|nr:uncharacterized protein LOC127279618 [Leptopilina boulardi]
MKFLYPLTIFIICAFQVHFILSNEIIGNEKFVQLRNVRNMVKERHENLTMHLNQEKNYIHNDFRILIKSLNDTMINLAFSKNSQLQIINQTENCSDTSFCRNDAYRTVLELIDNHNKSLIQIADENMENIIKNSQLINLTQVAAKILLTLNSEMLENNECCLKNHTSYKTAVDCLDDKIRKAQDFLNNCITKEHTFSLENSPNLRNNMIITYNKMSKQHISLLLKLGRLEPSFKKCTFDCVTTTPKKELLNFEIYT